MIQMIRSKDEASSAITLSEGEANGAKIRNSDHANYQELFSLSFKAFHGHDKGKQICIAHKELDKTCKEISGIFKSASSLS